jgi:hypothetical protein
MLLPRRANTSAHLDVPVLAVILQAAARWFFPPFAPIDERRHHPNQTHIVEGMDNHHCLNDSPSAFHLRTRPNDGKR